jgi:hypothetical protein
MLDRHPADSRRVIARALSWISLACCTLVLVSFLLFAHDQVAGASVHQQDMLAGNVATAPAGSHARHGQPRRFIDAAAGDLTSPFGSIVSAHNAWVREGIPTVAALLVYGVGLGFLRRLTAEI